MRNLSRETLLVSLLFLLLASVFFLPALVPEFRPVLGVDGNFSIRSVRDGWIDDGFEGWWTPYWLGGSGVFGVQTWTLASRLLDPGGMLYGLCIASWATAMLFTYLLLREYRLERGPAVIGAAAFGFTPHFVTLIYPVHLTVLSAPAFIAALFYFITRWTERGRGVLDRAASALAGGCAWGMLMNEDPQRGLYFSFAAAAYLLFRAWSDCPDGINFPSRLRAAFGAGFWLRAGLAAGVMLSVFSFELQRQAGGKNMAGGVTTAGTRTEEAKWQFSTSWSHHPAEWIDLFVPGYHGELSGDPARPYHGTKPVSHNSDAAGFTVCFWAAVAILTGVRRDSRVRFFAVLSLLALLLACGRFWPGRPLFQLWFQLPLMDRFRAPVKFMSVATFSLSLLAGFGVQYFSEAFRRDRTRFLALLRNGLVAIAVAGFVGLLGTYAFQPDLAQGFGAQLGSAEAGAAAAKARTASLLRMVVWAVLVLGAVWMTIRFRDRKWARSAGVALIGVVLVIELFAVDGFYLRRALFKPDDFYAQGTVLRFLNTQKEEQAPFRVAASLKVFHGGQAIPLPLTPYRGRYVTYHFPYYGIETMENTPQSRVAAEYRSFFRAVLPGAPQKGGREMFRELLERNIRFWQLCNVKYVVTDGYLYGLSRQPVRLEPLLNENPALEKVAEGEDLGGRGHYVYRVQGALPRFAVFENVRVQPGPEEVLSRLADEARHPARTVLTETPLTSAGAVNGTAEPRAGRVIESRRGYARVRVDADRPSLLLHNARYSPDWRVHIDGVRAGAVRANYLMRGVLLPEGRHEVEFRFAPRPAFRGLASGAVFVSLAAAILLGGAGGWLDSRNRKNRSG
ncbi:putative membrane protein [Kiritimatiella glycovorans]|uniref:Putative membrane protein n=2 Tax=Kiritimatiella glycovorans TaxID=1307763 RepID=A0A0G3EHY4_9BACT|nr:putative membrane protein [Kiritimatiella glycovorans]